MRGVLAWAALVAVAGCGGAQRGASEARGGQDGPQTVAAYLPEGAVAYARVDLAQLRTSTHAERVLGWYRTFVPAIPGFEADHPGARAFEALVARTHEVAMALFVPQEPPGTDDVAARLLADPDEGVLILLRTEVDLAWVEEQAATLDVELARRTHGGQPVLVTPDPTGEQLMVASVGEGLLAVSIGGLAQVTARLDAARRRVEARETSLADVEAAALMEAANAEPAPVAVAGRFPPALAAELAQGTEGAPFQARGLEGLRGAALHMDPSHDLHVDLLLRMDAAAQAQMLARDMTAEAERQAQNAFVLLLGLDLWLAHTETRADGHDVHTGLRLSEADLRMWFFHVERLAAAAKAFFTEGGLGGLFGGLLSGAAAPPMEPPPPSPEPLPVEGPSGEAPAAEH